MITAPKVKRALIYFAMFAYALIVMLFCTKNSPFYAFNDWSDPNTYFTMGKGMFNGAVPYRDLFDHKGPFLFFLYGIGYLISSANLNGVFLIQSVSLFLTMFFAYKIAKIFLEDDTRAYMTAFCLPFFIVSGTVYVGPTSHGGGSPEEFCLPLLACSVYLALKQCKSISKEARIPMFFQGVVTALVFMMKFNIAVFFAGTVISFFIYRLAKKEYKLFLFEGISLACGFIAAMLPYLVYALSTGSLRRFFSAYIKFNLAYAEGDSDRFQKLMNLTNQLVAHFKGNAFYAVLIGAGLLYILTRQSKRMAGIYKPAMFFGFLSLWLGIFYGSVFAYSTIPLTVFMIFPLCAFFDVTKKLSAFSDNVPGYVRRITLASASVVVLLATIGNNGLTSNPLAAIYKEKPAVCQLEIAAIINADMPENRTLLELHRLDSGLYTAANIIPKTYHFYMPLVSYEVYPYVLENQLESVAARENRYIVFNAGEAPLKLEDVAGEDIISRLQYETLKYYDLVGIFPGTARQAGQFYHLYRLRDQP